jgi:hypothetical protein
MRCCSPPKNCGSSLSPCQKRCERVFGHSTFPRLERPSRALRALFPRVAVPPHTKNVVRPYPRARSAASVFLATALFRVLSALSVRRVRFSARARPSCSFSNSAMIACVRAFDSLTLSAIGAFRSPLPPAAPRRRLRAAFFPAAALPPRRRRLFFFAFFRSAPSVGRPGRGRVCSSRSCAFARRLDITVLVTRLNRWKW